MAALKFIENSNKAVAEAKLKQQRVMPVGQLCYTDSVHLPMVLPVDTLMFTTDTRELYVGTGSGIKRVNLGSDGEIIDKTDYLTKEEATSLYILKENLDPRQVVTATNLDQYTANFQKTLEDMQKEIDLKIDAENTFTKEELTTRFPNNIELGNQLDNKVDQEILTNVGNHAFIQNISPGVTLKFQNIGLDTESFLRVGKDDIRLYVKDTKSNMIGGRLYITTNGAYYTHSNDEDFGQNDEIMTYQDLVDVRDLMDTVREEIGENRQICIRAQESARQSELTIEQATKNTKSALDQANYAINVAQDALNIVNGIQDTLDTAAANASAAEQHAASALATAQAAKEESEDALSRLQLFQTSITGQITQINTEISHLKSGDSDPDPGADYRYKIVDVQKFNDVKNVTYNTAVKDLGLPTTISVSLDSPYTSGDISHDTVGVTWQTGTYQPTQTNYSQVLIGIPTETARISNPNHFFATYTVKVQEEVVPEPTPDDYAWTVVFAVPSNANEIPNFSSIISKPNLTSEDMMGDLDGQSHYIEPNCELYLIGTLNKISPLTTCFIVTTDQQTTDMNHSVLDVTVNGFKVPVLGVASAEDIATYETQTLTRAFVNSNGAYQYVDDTLIFDHGVDANNVYMLAMKK